METQPLDYWEYPQVKTYSRRNVEALLESAQFLRIPFPNHMTLGEIDDLIKEASF